MKEKRRSSFRRNKISYKSKFSVKYFEGMGLICRDVTFSIKPLKQQLFGNSKVKMWCLMFNSKTQYVNAI